MRGLLATSYQYVLFAQIGLAIGQPFILNSITKVAARWFPIEERATASGLGSLAMYVGIIIGMALTPYMTIRTGIEGTLLLYGVASVIGAVIFFVMVREHPPTPPCPAGQEERALVFDGLKQMLKTNGFQRLMLIFFIGLGVSNGVTTWIENIVRFGMDGLKSPQTGSMTIPLVILIALMVLCTLLSVNLKESNLLRK